MQDKVNRHRPQEQDPQVRRHNFSEVSLGYNLATAIAEAARCLNCKNPLCRQGCPVQIDIPAFIQEIKVGEIDKALEILKEKSSLPAVCGRVCPQEEQCEKRCILGIKGEPVAIGNLERFAADHGTVAAPCDDTACPINGGKIAILGAGPAGLAAAGDLARHGYQVTIFEALHTPGGVLMYGIPEFRLPKDIVQKEITMLKTMGVKIETSIVVGKTVTIDELMGEEDFQAVFIGTGAGLPYFLGLPGEDLNGIYSANEFLTRVNLMKAYQAESTTPIYCGKNVAVVGAGNVAMDAARTALRLGAEKVYIIYRRSEDEMPARKEEIHHAKEEGVELCLLAHPLAFHGDEKNWVTEAECIRMELGEPDASGRRSPKEIPGSNFKIPVDTVIIAIGQGPSPIIQQTTPGLDTNKRGNITAQETGATSREGVFAGGDVVTGAATVISAMGAGKIAAQAIHEYMQEKEKN
ncbi:MAG: NADPH-dependent glutamate synthase [Negativicutes bacterium]|nr:NADPH-dependent glutamate synthase [Negativicutes bacterium]